MAVELRATATATGENSSTCVVSRPTGVIDGDILLCFLNWWHDTSSTITPPAGWSQVVAPFDNGGDGASNVGLYWKRASSEGASYTWTFASGSYSFAIVAAYSGCIAAGTPFEDSDSAIGTTTSVSLPSITTTSDNSQVIGFVTSYNWNKTYTSSGLTEQLEFSGAWLGHALQASAGASGAKAVTMSGADNWGGAICNLAVATGGGGGAVLRPMALLGVGR